MKETRMKILMALLGLCVALSADTFQEKMQSKLSEGTPKFQKDLMDCLDNNAQACFLAGDYYSKEHHKENKQQKEIAANDVAALYKRSCELGYAKGCTAYAMIYEADSQKDPKKSAKYYFNKACEGGDFSACTMLKMMPSKE